jgi:conjugal transfer pilus assembly protein TraV
MSLKAAQKISKQFWRKIKMRNRMILCVRVVLVVSGLVLQGCSFMGIGASSYACPGGIEGVRCMSARQVYAATEHSDYVKSNEDIQTKTDQNIAPVVTKTQRVAVPSIEQPVPIRTAAKVMRIWTAPWEDQEGDLHADGFVYTEIENRKWNLGERFVSPSSNLSPLNTRTQALNN